MLINNKRNLNRDVFEIFFMDFFSVFTLGLVLVSTNFRELFKGACKDSGHYFKILWFQFKKFGEESAKSSLRPDIPIKAIKSSRRESRSGDSRRVCFSIPEKSRFMLSKLTR